MTRHTRPAKDKSRGQLRIIGGDWRGRRLDFPLVEGLRPSSDRLRETLFNWLQAEVPGRHCLDLFAGSGALGLEALSRGAASATLVDKSPVAVRQLEDNLRRLGARNAQAVRQPVEDWLGQAPAGAGFDLVFLDPPFAQGLIAPSCQLLEAGGWLKTQALIYLEAEQSLGEPRVPEHWQRQRHKRAGRVNGWLFERHVRKAE